MLFAIPYCATQSFLVTYAEVRGLNVSVSLFFPAYAVVLIVLRLSLRKLFDKLPFHVFLLVSALSELLAILFLTVMKNNAVMLLASCFLAGGVRGHELCVPVHGNPSCGEKRRGGLPTVPIISVLIWG